MVTESKGRAWFGKIYNKLETILVEVDSFTSQSTLCLKSSDPPGLDSVIGEPKEVAEDRSSGTSNAQEHHDLVDSPSCKSPSDPPSHQNFDIPGHVRVEERVQGNSLQENSVQGDSFMENSSASSLSDGEILSTSPLLEEYCDANLTSDTALGDEATTITDDESQITSTSTSPKFSAGNSLVFSGEESVEEVRVESSLPDGERLSTSSLLEDYCDASLTSTNTLCEEEPIITDEESKITNTSTPQKFSAGNSSVFSDNPDDAINGNSDVAPLDTNAFYGIEFREDPPSYVDDNALYATRVRTIAPLGTNALYASYVDDSALHAMRLRTEKLRSFKRKILDALTSKRRREKEYEQLAIWFGDANMGSDLATEEDSIQTEAMDSRSSQILGLEDSQWELL